MPLMDVGFAIICPLARHRRPHIQFLSIGSRVCSTLLSDPASRLTPLRFANPSPPSGWEEDFHLQAIEHARHNRHRGSGRPLSPATPPYMRVRIRRFRGLRMAIEQPRKTERVKVGDRKRDGQGRAARQTPGAVRTARRLCSEVLTYPELT